MSWISCRVLTSCLAFWAGFLCLRFCIPAFASAFVSYIEATTSRVRRKNSCNYFRLELYMPLLLLLGRLLLLLVMLLLCR